MSQPMTPAASAAAVQNAWSIGFIGCLPYAGTHTVTSQPRTKIGGDRQEDVKRLYAE